jgi:hypothetical protein
MNDGQSLLSYFEAEQKSNRVWWLVNFVVAQTSYWVAIASSFGSAIAISIDNLPKIFIAVLAAIPGVVILVESTFRYSQRADWHSLYSQKLRGLIRQLKFEVNKIEEISKNLSDLEAEMEGRTPPMRLGMLQQTPNKKSE